MAASLVILRSRMPPNLAGGFRASLGASPEAPIWRARRAGLRHERQALPVSSRRFRAPAHESGVSRRQEARHWLNAAAPKPARSRQAYAREPPPSGNSPTFLLRLLALLVVHHECVRREHEAAERTGVLERAACDFGGVHDAGGV